MNRRAALKKTLSCLLGVAGASAIVKTASKSGRNLHYRFDIVISFPDKQSKEAYQNRPWQSSKEIGEIDKSFKAEGKLLSVHKTETENSIHFRYTFRSIKDSEEWNQQVRRNNRLDRNVVKRSYGVNYKYAQYWVRS